MIFWKSIRYYLFLLIIIGSAAQVSAQPERFNIQRLAFHEKIDNKQKQIDVFDGQYDEIIWFKDPIQTKKGTNAYITLVDTIQSLLEEKNTDGAVTYEYLLELYSYVSKINTRNYHLVEYYENLFENLTSIIIHKEDSILIDYLLRDMQSSVANIQFYKELPVAEKFLLKAAQLYPNEVLKVLDIYSKQPYAQRIVDEVAKVSPQAIKKYFNSKNLINTFVLQSQDSVVNLITDMYNRYGNESKIFYFIDMIYHQESSPDVLNSVSRFPHAYLSALIKLKQKDHPIGNYDVERELSIKALEEVRKVNDLHDETDSTKRFAAVRNMGASELYTLIVYSPEEIFTSTFNGFFERLTNNIQKEGMNGYHLLENVNFNKFRTFIKLCAGYNALEKFLSNMSEEEAVLVLKKFVSELNADDGNISEAVNVADTFGSLDNQKYLDIFEVHLKAEYYKPYNSRETKTLYGLLLKLLYQKMGKDPAPLLELELANFAIPPIEKISLEEIANTEGTDQMHFFFDDEDGLSSYSTFITAFKTAGYTIQEKEHIVIITAKGKRPTTIYANKPLSEREGQMELVEMCQQGEIQPSIIVHRGHSYYAMNTISQIPEYAKVVFLGSCGGYHNITEVIKRAPQAHIIASKQIGTYVVNNSLLVEMSKMLKDQDELAWAPLWKSLDGKLKGSGKGYERFLDYVPPHRNMGAIFIQAYNTIAREDDGH